MFHEAQYIYNAIYIYALMIFHNIPNKVGEILSTKVNSICFEKP